MQTLREVLAHTQEDGAAAGHFNIADLVLLKAVFAVAQGSRCAGAGWHEGKKKLLAFRSLLRKNSYAEPCN